jgi:FMN phosphatase YigB (HAD superfamily)
MVDIPGCTGPMAGWPRIEVVPGVRESLARLQPAWRLCLATNAADSDEADIRAALQRGGLDRLVEDVYCFRRLGFRKPSLDFFTAVLTDLGLPAARVIMVGDSLEGDVHGAVRAGLRAVWFDPAGSGTVENPMIRTMRDFRSLSAILADLAPDLIPPTSHQTSIRMGENGNQF